MNETYLTTKQVAERYNIYSETTLRMQRYQGNSPFYYIKIGKKILYPDSKIREVIGKYRLKGGEEENK